MESIQLAQMLADLSDLNAAVCHADSPLACHGPLRHPHGLQTRVNGGAAVVHHSLTLATARSSGSCRPRECQQVSQRRARSPCRAWRCAFQVPRVSRARPAGSTPSPTGRLLILHHLEDSLPGQVRQVRPSNSHAAYEPNELNAGLDSWYSSERGRG